MITGSEEESRALMMNAAVRIVAQYGFEGFTTKKWAAEAGVAEGSLYYHFKSKSDLLDESFFMIDQEVSELYLDVSGAVVSKENVRGWISDLWRRYYHYLLENPKKTLYYYRYRTSPRYTEEVQKKENGYFGVFPEIVRKLDRIIGTPKDLSLEVLWYYILDTTTSMAFRVITGGVLHTESTERQVVSVLTNGLLGLLDRQVES